MRRVCGKSDSPETAAEYGSLKNYLNDVHLTILSSFQVTVRKLFDHIVLYKAGYYDIDNSTSFILPEETIKEFRSKLSSNCLATEVQGGNVRSALYGIADLCDGELPDSSKVSELHEQMDKEPIKLVADIENHESSTVKVLENSAASSLPWSFPEIVPPVWWQVSWQVELRGMD